MFSTLVQLECEHEYNERAVRIRRTRLRLRRRSQRAQRAVHFSRARKCGTTASFLHVTYWIFYFGFPKTFEPEQAGIAFAAGETFW
jgi:hypothetical protein